MTVVYTWPNVTLAGKTVEFFEEYMYNTFGMSAQFLEEIPVTRRRTDTIFAANREHAELFGYGAKLLEDVYWENLGCIYPMRVVRYIF